MEFDFTIGITTRNRWDDLKITLKKIMAFGWNEVPVIIIDDFSDTPCPFDISNFICNFKILRLTESKGLIVRRNQIAQLIETPYYLSLDDDSYPDEGSIEQALLMMKSRSDIFGIAFPIYNPIHKQHQVASLKKEPYQVRSFIGCAHLLNAQKFKSLGGYREELVHQGEEMDIAVRAFAKGWTVYHVPSLLVHHHMTLAGRNWDRMDYFGARNNILWNDWYLPVRVKFWIQAKHILARIILSIRVRRMGQLRGIRDAFRSLGEFRKFRQELSMSLFKEWQKLPVS